MSYTPIPIGAPDWGPPVNAAFTDLDNRVTANTNSIGSNLDNLVYNVRNHGAVGDGVADDAPAINALIDQLEASSTNGTIYFPRGTYLLGSALTPTKALRYTGDQGATLKSTASDVFNFAGNYMHPGFNGQVGVLEIDHLTLDATGGHVFTGAVINQGSFHDLNLIQRSSNKSVWNSNSTLLVVNFKDIISTVYGATRSVPAWSVTGVSTADVANITWTNCLFQNPDADATQYQVLLQATDGTANRRYHEQCAFINCYFEMPYGGAVKCLSGEGTLFQNCRVYDIFTNTPGNSMFYVGSGASSTWPSTNTTFIGCGRDLQGPNGSTTWDIQLEATSVQTTIQNYSVRDIPTVFDGHPFFNLGNSTSVTLINNAEQTLTNANGTGFNNITADGSRSGALAPTNFEAADSGFLAWAYDSALANGGTDAAQTSGTVYLSQIIVRQPITTTAVSVYVAQAGATLTSGQNFLGLYNSTGTRVAVTADQTTAWGTTGYKSAAWTASTPLTPGKYWVAFLGNGTTPARFARAAGILNATLYNGTLGTGQLRFASNATAQTSLPSSITPASNVATNLPVWAGLT